MGLIHTLRENKEIRRLFGRKEIEIIEKQLLGIKLKASENTRLSRDIKKKFIAIKKLSENEREFGLKKGSIIKEKIERVIELIKNSKYFSKIKKIVLFGSTAENQRTFHSDIDISVEFSEINQKEASEFKIKTSGESGEMVDIQVYNFLPEKIKKEINEKLNDITKYLDEIIKYIPETYEEYCNNGMKKAACERIFEKIIEAILETAFLILRYKELDAPREEAEVFKVLSDNNIIDLGLAEKLKEAKSMRNIIVHEYGEVDDLKVYTSITEELEDDVNNFIKCVESLK